MSYYGNRWAETQGLTWTFRIDGALDEFSVRFTAQESKTVDQVRLRTRIGGTPVSHRIGIQADVGGDPSGTYLGSVDSSTFSDGDWSIFDIVDVALTKGTVYHIVVTPLGTPDGSNWVEFRAWKDLMNMIPYDCATDSDQNCLTSTDGGSSWSVRDDTPIYILDYTDGTYEGVAYHAKGDEYIGGAGSRGERFTVTGGDKVVSAIDWFIKKTGSPADSLYVNIYNYTDSEWLIQDELFATEDQVGTSYDWVSHTLSSQQTLVNGKDYGVYLESPLCDGYPTDDYQMRWCQVVDSAVYRDRSYDGENGYECGDLAEEDPPLNQTLFVDFVYRFTLVAVTPVEKVARRVKYGYRSHVQLSRLKL